MFCMDSYDDYEIFDIYKWSIIYVYLMAQLFIWSDDVRRIDVII